MSGNHGNPPSDSHVDEMCPLYKSRKRPSPLRGEPCPDLAPAPVLLRPRGRRGTSSGQAVSSLKLVPYRSTRGPHRYSSVFTEGSRCREAQAKGFDYEGSAGGMRNRAPTDPADRDRAIQRADGTIRPIRSVYLTFLRNPLQ